MEFSKPLPLGAQASLLAQRPLTPPPEVARVAKSGAPEKTGADARYLQNQKNAAGANKRQAADNQPQFDPDTPAGPPPAFKVSLLEMARNLQRVMARVEAARGHDRNTEGIRPDDAASLPDTAPGTPQAVPDR